MAEKVPFLDMFPGCGALRHLCGGLDRAEVREVLILRETMTMTADVWFPVMPAPADIAQLEEHLAAQYRLRAVTIKADHPAPEVKRAAKSKEKILLGRPIRANAALTPMSELTLESGSVTVEGRVFLSDSREIAKRGAAVLSFEMTDNTGSVHVSKFLRGDDDQSIIQQISPGMYLKVQGSINFDKYINDMVLEPRSIVESKPVIRQDTAADKRVELHLHTRFSTMDALADPGDLVKRAAQWGHPAIAVTDHGCAQAFPDMWKAAKKHGIKIIYGVEGYLVNDVDGVLAARGPRDDLPLDQEYIAFDIETTGLRLGTCRMTEIGAIRFRGGEILEEFNTFVSRRRSRA